MTTYGPGVRSAADMFARGLSPRAVARRLRLSSSSVRQWEQTFRSVGREGLLDMGCKRSYDWDTKVAAESSVFKSA